MKFNSKSNKLSFNNKKYTITTSITTGMNKNKNKEKENNL